MSFHLLLTNRKRQRAFGVFIGLIALTLGSPALAAGTENSTASPAFTWGGDLRLRNEYSNNLLTLDSTATRHEQNYQRYRGRLWTKIGLTADLSLSTRLAWESFNWNRDSYKAPFKTGWVTSEGVFDQLALTWRKPLGLPVTLTVGRQDIMLGDAWLIAEGTPLDGSRTIYFDAARATWQVSNQTTLDCIYIDQAARSYDRLSTLNNQSIPTEEQDERSAIIYLTTHASESTRIDAYFIHRDTTPVLANGDDASYSVLGGRVVAKPSPHWQLKGEVAHEFGRKNQVDLRAWGFLGQASWLAGDSSGNELRMTMEALSGDKPGTGNDEQFDMVWGRYPRWSEINIMLFAPESRVAQMGNLLRVGPGWSVAPVKGLSFSIDYNAVWAMENNRSTSSGFFSADGKFRGHLGRFVLKRRWSPRWSSLLVGEVFKPGDYYGSTKQDTATFLRTEILLSF